MVSAADYAYHKHEAPIIYADNTKLIKTLTFRVNQLFKQFHCCKSIHNNVVSFYNYEFNNLIIWEMLNASCFQGVKDLVALFEKESLQIIQEGVLAAWLTLDDTRFSRSILRQAGELSYGVVLKHPIVIKRAASYLCGFTREDELQCLLPTSLIIQTTEIAIERVMLRRPNESRASILAELKRACII